MFTFKNNKPTGKYRSFNKMSIDIKLKSSVVGQIHEDLNVHQCYRIGLMVENSEGNCPFKWIFFKSTFKSFDEAKLFLKNNFNRITNKYKIYISND